jgi:ABC-type transport system involved in multi-copper enzyme maturation, permease component
LIKLIKNELSKIFLRKNVYIMLAVVISFVFYSNYILREKNQVNNPYASNLPDIKIFEESLNKIDPDTSPEQYIRMKNSLDSVKLVSNYPENTWQRNILTNGIHFKYITAINQYAFGKEKDEEKMIEAMKEYDEFVAKLDNDNWKGIIKEEISLQEKELKKLRDSLLTADIDSVDKIERNIALLEVTIDSYNIRLDKEINYIGDYLDKAVISYIKYSQSIVNTSPDAFRNEYNYKQQLQAYIEELTISNYIIENNIDTLSKSFHPSISATIYEQYDIFILILILLISGGIISEEFSKGTIKLLLVRPHSRTKILLSKYITALLIIIFSYFVVAISQVAIEWILSGTTNFSTEVAIYNFTTYTVNTHNIFIFILIDFLHYIPVYIILTTLSFAISTVFTSTTLGITLPVVGMLGGTAINYTVMRRQIISLKYFITLNWDFPVYINGRLPQLEGITWQFSMFITILYLVALLLVTFIEFKRKNITNI